MNDIVSKYIKQNLTKLKTRFHTMERDFNIIASVTNRKTDKTHIM